ncbi:MAG: DUF255 domain-containing protein [Lewinellaceae bacterium]|nr:DUF255 domain-containing protein [Lewinellaceae bacterium]
MRKLTYTMLLSTLLVLGTRQASGQSAGASDGIRWLSWQDAQQLQETTHKKIILEVYTDWCSWCKKLDTESMQDPAVVQYINKNFYPVRLNAQERADLEYQNKVYHYNSTAGMRGYNELVTKLLQGNHSFPSIVFFDENLEIIQSFSGFRTAAELLLIAQYFGANSYKNKPWSQYLKENNPPASPAPNAPGRNQ